MVRLLGGMDVYEPIPLEPLMNNKGFYRPNSLNSAFFSAGGACYPADQLPQGESVHVFGIPFRFLNGDTHRFDNVELSGQVWRIEPRCARTLWLLGAAENGSFVEPLLVEYQNGSRRSARLGLTDWVAKEALYGERAAFQCTCVYVEGRELSIHATMWLQEIKTDPEHPITAIHLPDNPMIHLFAGTLEVASRG